MVFNTWLAIAGSMLIISLSLALWILYSESGESSTSESSPSVDSMNRYDTSSKTVVASDEHTVTEDLASKILNSGDDDLSIVQGFTTETYSWRQTGAEVEVFIFLPKSERFDQSTLQSGIECSNHTSNLKGLRGKEIKVSFENFHVTVTELRENTKLFSGMLYAEVIPEECSWQIEDSPRRCIWLTLFKKIPTKRVHHWREVIAGDKQSIIDNNLAKLGTPVHDIDVNDPKSLKAAIDKIKQLKKNL